MLGDYRNHPTYTLLNFDLKSVVSVVDFESMSMIVLVREPGVYYCSHDDEAAEPEEVTLNQAVIVL